MKCIEENTERMGFLKKTLELEQRQKQRLIDISIQKEKDFEEAKRIKLFDGTHGGNDINQGDPQRKDSVPPGTN